MPPKSLTAGIPVSVRPKDDEGNGNAISFIVATLATDVADPAARLKAIRDSVSHAKAHVQGLPRAAMMQYTVLLMAPTIITLLTGIGGRTGRCSTSPSPTCRAPRSPCTSAAPSWSRSTRPPS